MVATHPSALISTMHTPYDCHPIVIVTGGFREKKRKSVWARREEGRALSLESNHELNNLYALQNPGSASYIENFCDHAILLSCHPKF